MSIQTLLVVNNPTNWKLPLDAVEVVSAKDYLSQETLRKYPSARVFNLCRSYSYQSVGYYVSLLAEARGHRAIPSAATLKDFNSGPVARSVSDDIDEIVQTSLKGLEGKSFELAVYFGQSLDCAYSKLATQLYRFFPAPLLKAQFTKGDRWVLSSVAPMQLSSIESEEREQLTEFAQQYFSRKRQPKMPKQRFLYDMAILVNPEDPAPPSNAKALEKIIEAAREVGFYVEAITRADAARLSEFDALFIRETTGVNHHTYRMSRLAHTEGLVVIDDPWSILRSANKIYLAESLARAKLPAPETWILSKDDLANGLDQVKLPCVLKQPDGAFSRGIRKAETSEELREYLQEMLKSSELILAQEFTPSEYDWRIGVLDNQPLFACKYYMAAGHWQIYNWAADSANNQSGDHETMHVEFAPKNIVEIACKAAKLIGDGLYGVDLKQVGDRVMVIEVNDNPNIDAGVEDSVLGMELYRRIARSFRRRIEQARA